MPRSWNKETEFVIYAREGFSVRWRGKRYDFAPTLDELTNAGIQLSQEEQKSGELTPSQVLRYVCHALDHLFFASEDCLRDLLDQYRFDVEMKYAGEEENYRSWAETPVGELDEFPFLSCDLELFLQTRDWRHPRFGSAEGEISIRDAFEPLAKALAANDLSHWHGQDPALFNSHWRFWAEMEITQEQAVNEQLAVLVAEGERFQKFLQTLPPESAAEIVRRLKIQWGQTKRDITHLFNTVQGEPLHFVHQGVIEFDGQTFTFGPHLWGEHVNLSFVPNVGSVLPTVKKQN